MASVSRKNRKAILGKKVGMTQIFTDDGSVVPVTVLEAGPCAILQIKTPERDGYSAYQLAFGERRKPAKRPEQAKYDALGIGTKQLIREIPFIDEADLLPHESEAEAAGVAAASGAPSLSEEEGASDAGGEAASEGESGGEAASEGESGGEGADGGERPSVELVPGVRIGVGAFRSVARVDIQGVTKGRGFTGTIKRHNFRRGDAGHGSKNVREPGSTGQHTDPGRVFKGKRMPGHHGHERRKVRNLQVVRVDEERNLLVVKGAVPGPNGSFVYIEESLA